MSAIDLPLLPTGRAATTDELNAVIQSIQGDDFRRGSDGVARPRSGSYGSAAIPAAEVHADTIFQGGKKLLIDPADIPRHNVLVEGVVEGPAVPGLPGTCGQLRFAPDGSYAYVAAGTIIEIAGEQFSIGYTSAGDAPASARILSQSAIPNTPLAPYWDIGPVWGWGYDAGGSHEHMPDGVFVFADSDGNILQTNTLAPSVVLQSQLPSSNVTANTYAFVSSVGRWFRRSGGNWIDSGAAFVGACRFDSGRPARLYSARTRQYRNAVANLPEASGVFGQTFLNTLSIGNWTAYENNGSIIPVGIANGQQVFYSAVTATDPRLGDGRSTPITAQPTRTPASDFLIAGEQVYGWHSYVPPALPGPQAVRITPQPSLPIIPSLGGLRGVHAFQTARVILTAHSYTATQGLSSVGNFRDRPPASRRSSCFVPGYFGFYGPSQNNGLAIRLIAYEKIGGLNDYPNPYWAEGEFGPEGFGVDNPELQQYTGLRAQLGG